MWLIDLSASACAIAAGGGELIVVTVQVLQPTIHNRQPERGALYIKEDLF